MALAAFWLTERTVLASLEWALYDWRTSYLSSPVPTHADIVVVALDDATLSDLPYQVPLERTFLARLVEAIRAGNPAVLGLDILLDRPTTPQADARLVEALAAPGAPVVVAVLPDRLRSRPPGDAVTDWTGTTQTSAAKPADSDPWHIRLGDTVMRANAHLRAGVGDRVIRRRSGGVGETEPSFADAVHRAARPGPKTAIPVGPVRERSGDRALIPFAATADNGWPFARMSARDLLVLAELGALDWLAGKIVLVGKVTPFEDRHPTPLRLRRPGESDGRGAPGVIVHAYQVAQSLDASAVARPGPMWRAGLALLGAIGGMVLALRMVQPVRLALTAAALAILFVLLAGALYAAAGAMVPVAGPVFAFAGAVFLASALERHEERARQAWLKKSFSLYLAPVVVDHLLKDPDRLTLGVERREITVLFTDLEGFTTFIERHDDALPKEILNRYFDVILGVVFRHGGTVDKIVGDAVHAYFNAPLDQPDHAERAVACALDIVAQTERLRSAISDEVGGFGRTRIGVHRGMASVGNFGNARRFDYTAHGTTVNLASRLEQANKDLGSQICASEAVRAGAPGFRYRDLGTIAVRSIAKPVHVFEPIAREAPADRASMAGAPGGPAPQSSASAMSSRLSVSRRVKKPSL